VGQPGGALKNSQKGKVRGAYDMPDQKDASYKKVTFYRTVG
jgi:hypothetical protein